VKTGRRSFVLGSTLLACTRSNDRSLDGAGATLPYPLYSKWSAEYAKVDPKVRVNYQPLGSGAGVRQITDGVVDFGATDDPLAEPNGTLVQIPTTIGAVVVTYNHPGVADLQLAPELVADIFLGTVARWDDARLAAANPSATFAPEPIAIVHRADGSGTSAALTKFLSAHHAGFRERVGAGKIPSFPVGVGAKGNEGVAASIKSTPGSFGYVELAHAKSAGLSIARVKNRRGKFVSPSLESLDRAARAVNAQSDLSIVDADDEAAYPIAALSLVVVPRTIKDPQRGAALARFLWWAVHDGQKLSADLGYAPLPPALVARAESALRELKSEGKPLLGAV
jgi:phosphate transport system substrate-binding protein